MLVLPLMLSLALSAPVVSPVASAAAVHAATPVALASRPRLPLPKLRIPGRGKRAPSNSPMAVTDRRLRALVSQQEAWYVGHARYGNDITQVARSAQRADPAMAEVQVQILYASKRGWTAIASHPDAPGQSCVVFVGYREKLPMIPRTRGNAMEATDEGRPACDK